MMYCTVLYCIMMYCTVLYCTVLYYAVGESAARHALRGQEVLPLQRHGGPRGRAHGGLDPKLCLRYNTVMNIYLEGAHYLILGNYGNNVVCRTLACCWRGRARARCWAGARPTSARGSAWRPANSKDDLPPSTGDRLCSP